jgi:hypothetical protein
MAIYVREGAGGTGVSWANALSDLPTTFVRGETYYVADGSYGSHTFGTVGTSVITIKKATATDHGIETGWSAEYGDGQALFAAGWTFSTSYWNVDGQFGSLDGTFGFKVKRTNSDGKCVTINTGANYINLSYLDLDNAGYSSAAWANADVLYAGVTGGSDSCTFTHCWLHNTNRTCAFLYATSNYTFDGCWFTECINMDTYGVHGEAFSINETPNTGLNVIRNCTFRNIEGSAWIGFMNSFGNHSNYNWDVYNNVFYVDADHALDGYLGDGAPPSAADFTGSDGVVCVLSNASVTNINVYGNTFANLQENTIVALVGPLHQAYNSYVRNNLFIHPTRTPAWGTVTTGAVSNNVSTTDTSFATDYAAHDYRLSKATTEGYTLPSPYDVDKDGASRTSDGSWDVGAYEFGGAGALAQNGSRYYYRMRYQDVDGGESAWSAGSNYFDMAIVASGGVTLGAIAATGNAMRPKTASGGIVLGKIDVQGTTSIPVKYSSGGVVLGPIAVAGAAQRAARASGAVTLGVVAVAGAAQRTITARGGVVLGPVAASGDIILNNAAPIQLPGAKYYWRMQYKDAAGLVSAWSNGADYFITGATRGTIALGAVTVVGAITVTRNASGNVPLGAAAVSGNAARILTASGGVVLGVQTVDGSSARIITASGNITTPHHRVSGGSVMRTITARGNVPLGAMSVSGANVPTRLASGNISLGAIAVAGKMGHHASGGVVLGPIAVAGNAPGVTAIIHVTTRIVRRHTVTTRIARRHTVVTRLEGDRS